MINKDYIQEILIKPTPDDLKIYKRMGLDEYVSPTGARYPLAQDYFNPPRRSRINQDFVDSLAAGEHPDVTESKVDINPLTGKPRKVYEAPTEWLRTKEVPEVLAQIEKQKTVGVGEDAVRALKQTKGLARGVENVIGTFGSMAQWAAERAKIGDVLTKHVNIPGAGVVAEYLVRKFGPKKPTKFFDERMIQYAKQGEKWADFWEEQAQKGWEAPDPEVTQAKWREMPITKGVATISEAAPNYLAAIASSILTKSPQTGLLFISGLSGAGQYRRQRKEGAGIAKANAIAAMTGAWEYVTEKVPFDEVFKPAKSKFLKMLKLGSLESAQEFVQGIGENFLEYFGYKAKDLKSVPAAVKEGLEHTMDGWVENVVAGAGLGVIGGGIIPKGGLTKPAETPPTEGIQAPEQVVAGRTTDKGVELPAKPPSAVKEKITPIIEPEKTVEKPEVADEVPAQPVAKAEPMTFKEWSATKPNLIEVSGRMAEDGYAHYLEQNLGKTPTVEEVKRYGKIERLTTETLPEEAEPAKVVGKIPEVEVEAKPGPAKTLESIRKEGQQKADTTLVMPKNLEEENQFQKFIEQFTQFKSVGWPPIKAQKAIIKRFKRFAQNVPEFKLNPTFTFEKESGQLVFKDRYRFAFYPSHFGLDAEILKDGQTIRFDLESFGIKKPTKAALRKAEPFLGEPKILGRIAKKPIPVERLGKKAKPRKLTKVAEAYEKALVDIEIGKRVEVPGGVTYHQVTEKDIRRVAQLGKKAGRQSWTVERDILARQERGTAETTVAIGESIKIIRDVFSEKLKAEQVKPKGGGAIGDIGVGATGIDSGRIKVSMEPGAKPQTAGDIIDYMSRAFGIVIRGKATHHKQSLGWFDPKATGIRLKDVKSITTGTHEVAHHIDWTLNNRMSLKPPSKQIAEELMALGRALYGSRKPPGGYKSEGWAEFIREYLTGEEAQDKAPNLHKWFTEEYLPSHKDIAKKIAKTRDMITKWRLQGAEARVDSQINKKQIKGPFSEWLKRGLLWVETSFRDEFAPIKRAMKRVGIREGELTPAEDPYQIAVARADKAGAVARQFVLEYTTDMAGNRTGKGLREILKSVANEINSFTRWIITARARLLHKKGINPGISKADADYVYEKYDNEIWQNTLKELTSWNHRVLDYLVEAGGLDTEAANTIKKSNPIYIPFMRAFKAGELRMGGGYGKGVAKVTKPIKKIKGSGREIIDPIESMIKQTQKIIAVAHKAEIAKAIANLATKKGVASMIWKVPAPKQATRFEAEQLKKDIARIAYERMGLDPQEISSAMLEHWDDVLTVYSNAGQYYGKDNIVALVINGERQWYEVDPALYKAIEGVDQYTLPWFLSVTFGKATRMVRLGATGLNPSFGLIRNFLRDAMTFTVLSKHAKAGPVSAVKGITEDIIDTPAAKKFKAMGGKMSSQILADRRAVQNLKKHVLASTVAGKTIYTVAHPIDALRELFGITEAGTRIGEYGPALKAGEKKYGKGSKDAAIYALNQAQDVTTNFSRHGKIAKVLNQMIPFFNAAIQGPDKIIRTFGKRPVATSLKAILALTIPAIWSWWKYKDEEWYKNMPEYERVNYLHFRIPGTETIIRLPVPFELGHIFQSAPIAALDAWYRKDPKIVNEMFEESLRQANPFDWPATFRPIIDIMANEDFAGRPIVTKSAEYKLPEDQYGNYTTELMKVIGKTIGYSPAKLEHLVASYSGGLYTRIARTIDLRNKEEITKSDMPIIGTLFLREPYAPRAQLNRFYEKRDLLNQKYSSGNITGKEKRLRVKYNSISRELSEQWKKIPDAKTQKEKIRIYQAMKRQLNKIRD